MTRSTPTTTSTTTAPATDAASASAPATGIALHKSGSVLDLSKTLASQLGSHTPAAITETIAAELDHTSWLLVDSNVLASSEEAVSLRMVLERATSQGVAIALQLNWQPQQWSLASEASPTAEVLRRFGTLADAATLIRASEREAAWFFGTTDPVRIHEALPKRPAVLIGDPSGPLHWCIGGRSGQLARIESGDAFLPRLIEGLGRHPGLLGRSGPGQDAFANPEGLADLLKQAAGGSPRS